MTESEVKQGYQRDNTSLLHIALNDNIVRDKFKRTIRNKQYDLVWKQLKEMTTQPFQDTGTSMDLEIALKYMSIN